MKNKKINIKIPKLISNRNIINYFNKHNLKIFNQNKKKKNINYNVKNSDLIKADLNDLYFLHKFIILNKRLKVLEFGSGWSTLCIANALYYNKLEFSNNSKLIRQNNKFSICIVETSKKYLEITKKRLNLNFNSKIEVKYNYSKVELIKFNGIFCTLFKKFPVYNPDLIFLDGPSPFDTRNKINNFTNAHNDFMPMSADLLSVEYFLQPGTMIISDGRTANIEFLLNNFQRNWVHKYLRSRDIHILVLDEQSLGLYNDIQLDYYNK